MRYLPLFLLLLGLTGCTPPAADTTSPPSDETTSMDNTTTDRWRPGYHFTPPSGWMNDPNGMVYHDGVYHLFYQYYPDDLKWGPMHWGHATSSDLVKWEHQPIALFPDDKGYIFSGSCVVDKGNTSGLGSNGKDPLIAIFTYHDMDAEKAGEEDYESQGIAYSNDGGKTWEKYAGNPVLPNQGIKDFRDPKVRWDDKTARWTMTLAVKDHIEFYSSPNLIDWTYLSRYGDDSPVKGGVWECPELMPMRVVETGEIRYVLIVSINPGGPNSGSATFYYVGDWDGTTFTASPQPSYAPRELERWLDYGRDNYAAVTFANAPDDRTILIGWMSNWEYAQDVPADQFRSAMTVPRDLTLHETDFGYRLHQGPVPELKTLRGASASLPDRFEPGTTTIDLPTGGAPGCYELELDLELLSSSTEIYFDLTNEAGNKFFRFGWSTLIYGDERMFFTDRRSSGLTDFSPKFAPETTTAGVRWSNNSVLKLRVLTDRTSAEVFFDDGATAMTDIFFPEEPYTQLLVTVTGAEDSMDATAGYDVSGGRVWALREAGE